jgi:hypothetical protein
MLTAALIFVSLVSIALSGFGPLRGIAAVAGAALGAGVVLGVKVLCCGRRGPAELGLIGAPIGIFLSEWTLARWHLAPYPGASLHAFAIAAAAIGPLLALACAAVDHFVRAPNGPDEWPRAHVASALAAAACASAAGWALLA